MSLSVQPSEAVALGRLAADDRDVDAVSALLDLCRTSHRPEIRGIAALFLGVIEWDERAVPALTRLLADPDKVSLDGHPEFTDTMNGFKIYPGEVIGPGMAAATLATHNVGNVSAPIEKVARVALNEKAGWGKGWEHIADPEALLGLLTTDKLPVNPAETDPTERERVVFSWREGAADRLFRLADHLRAEHIPPLVAQTADWHRFGKVNSKNQASFLLRERIDLWTVEAITDPIDSDDKRVRAVVAHWLTRLAKRGDVATRTHLERLTQDSEPSVAKVATKGLKALDKAERKR